MALEIMLLAAFAVRAENVDLLTVPARNTVQLTIYNSEDLTLVRETRKVPFKPGANPLQFSWANTLIDPTSVELRFLTSREKLTVLDTTFPHAKPQMLYWNVQSEIDGEATIEITYFTSGIMPAPWMVTAFTLGEWPLFHAFFDQMAVPAGSCTVSPSWAVLIAFPTASGVKSAAVRVSE